MVGWKRYRNCRKRGIIISDAAVFVEGLAKRYDEVEALRGIDFEVPVGTIFGLLGPNGAGKTTAIRILSTILHPDAGRAEVMGYDVVREADDVRFKIGLAGQSAAVDPNLTGRENLQLIGRLAQLPREMIKPRADTLLERFGLTEAASRPLRTYSGGMRRRLDVAAALVQRPPVLFLDEPTTGLDIQSRSELWEVIRELVSEGSTVLLTTQYLEEADQLADRIAVVNRGKIVANDTAKALKARLGSTTIEIGFASEEEGIRTKNLLSSLFSDHTEIDGSKVRLTSNLGPLVLVDVLRSLEGEGLVPESLSVREPTLDEVFLALTGKSCMIDSPDSEEVPCD
jgi:ABC-2 type transport system ATP-binding protein